jgi:uncharacterized protein (TIGR00661 family)
MTKILYGIQGTGNGHLARARALVPELRLAGLDIDFILTGRTRKDYFNMDLFEGFDCYSGLSLIVDRGRLKPWSTMISNSLISFIRDARKLDVSSYDLVISDFEPLTAWASKRAKVECLGISHQSAFVHDIPKASGYTGSKILMNNFAPADTYVGLHWHHFNQPILPPLIEQLRGKPVIDNKILVYMGFEAIDDVVAFIEPYKDFEFHVYCKIPQAKTLGHIKLKPLSHSGFHRDLDDCAGVISNAGFELASECLLLGKKLLMKPLLGQYEQHCNALAMQSLNRATVIQSLNPAVLKQWLQLPCHNPIPYPNVAQGLARWIANGRKETVGELAEKMWSGCDIPFFYDEKFGNRLLPSLII